MRPFGRYNNNFFQLHNRKHCFIMICLCAVYLCVCAVSEIRVCAHRLEGTVLINLLLSSRSSAALSTCFLSYRRAGQRWFGLFVFTSRPQVIHINFPQRMILLGSLIPSHKYILKNLTFVVRTYTCGYVTALVKSFTWPG